MPDFPTSIYSPRTKENALGVIYDALKTRVGFAEDVTKLDAEVVSLETILGLSPNWASASVAERIKGIRSLSDANEAVITIKGANVGIGTTGPGAILGIQKNATALTALLIGNEDTTAGRYSQILAQFNQTDATGAAAIRFIGDNVGSAFGSTMQFLTQATGGALTANITILQSGNVGIATTDPTAKADIASDILRLRSAKTPSSAGAAGNAGDICWDSGYVYVCVATNTWKRSALATW